MTNYKSPVQIKNIRQIYKNPWLTLEEHELTGQDNKRVKLGILDYGDGVSILAINKQREFFLIREYKYAIRRFIFQLPSGSVDKNESPLRAAKRELLEETGLVSDEWKLLGITYPFPTNITTVVYLYLASSVKSVQKPEGTIELYTFSEAEIKKMIKENKITHAGSLVCLLRYLSDKTIQH